MELIMEVRLLRCWNWLKLLLVSSLYWYQWCSSCVFLRALFLMDCVRVLMRVCVCSGEVLEQGSVSVPDGEHRTSSALI